MDKKFNNIEVPSQIDMVIEDAIKVGKKNKKNNKRALMISAACVCFMVFGLVFYSNILVSDKTLAENQLPKVKSYTNLKTLLKNKTENYSMMEELGVAENSTKFVEKSNNSINDYSGTNNQVKMVDEGDKVKTNGENIFTIQDNKIIIVKAYPAENLGIISEITYDSSFIPIEMFIKDKYLVVIGSLTENQPEEKSIYRSIRFNRETKIFVYDISDIQNPKQVRELKLDGTYSQSRLIGTNVYIVGNKNIDIYNGELIDGTPSCKDTASKDNNIKIGYDDISYCPGSLEPNYIVTLSINLDKINDKANIYVFLGSGEDIYVSENNMYISGYDYSSNFIYDDEAINDESTIYKFSLKQGVVKFETSAKVKGKILNEFSMDESKGYLRVATTEDYYDINKASNNIFVLDNALSVVGKVEGIAKGEKIYSVRFMGNRGYMVTFKNTDPLFVIDLEKPTEPKILGQLKIPGFSNYLEPYDENHIIGFGQDTIEVNNKGNTVIKTTGMKVALFDVSDVNHPLEKFYTKIQGKGSSSDVLYDHKALLFSKEKSLLAFPVSYMDETLKSSFQGVNVYNIDITNGFNLKGQITHDVFNGNNNIERQLFIEDTLYTISNYQIKANKIKDLQEVSKLNIK